MQMIPMTTNNISHTAITVCGSIMGLLSLGRPRLTKHRHELSAWGLRKQVTPVQKCKSGNSRGISGDFRATKKRLWDGANV